LLFGLKRDVGFNQTSDPSPHMSLRREKKWKS